MNRDELLHFLNIRFWAAARFHSNLIDTGASGPDVTKMRENALHDMDAFNRSWEIICTMC